MWVIAASAADDSGSRAVTVDLIYSFASYAFGVFLVVLGVIGLVGSVRRPGLSMSNRLLAGPTCLFMVVLGVVLFLYGLHQERVLQTLTLLVIGSLGVMLAIDGPILAVRPESDLITRLSGVIVTPVGVWMIVGTIGGAFSASP